MLLGLIEIYENMYIQILNVNYKMLFLKCTFFYSFEAGNLNHVFELLV